MFRREKKDDQDEESWKNRGGDGPTLTVSK